MDYTQDQELFKECLEQTLIKAWEDEAFKKELIAAPVESIEKLTGKKLNLKTTVRMVVIDESAPTFCFKIPTKPELDDIELTEEQLAYVAGGGKKWEMFKTIASAAVQTAYNIISRPAQFFVQT